MRHIVNEHLVEKRTGLVRQVITFCLILLLGATALSFNRQSVLLAYGLMFPGTLGLAWAARAATKWLQRPRVDEQTAKALKGLDQTYGLYSYLLPAEHVLVGPIGMFVLELKPQMGKVYCQGEKYRRKVALKQLLPALAEEWLGKPAKRARSDVQKMQRLLAERLPEHDVPAQPVVVFTNPNVELEVVEPAIPTMHLRDFRSYLRTVSAKALSPDTLRALAELLDGIAG
jgi:hypothetical protein